MTQGLSVIGWHFPLNIEQLPSTHMQLQLVQRSILSSKCLFTAFAWAPTNSWQPRLLRRLRSDSRLMHMQAECSVERYLTCVLFLKGLEALRSFGPLAGAHNEQASGQRV